MKLPSLTIIVLMFFAACAYSEPSVFSGPKIPKPSDAQIASYDHILKQRLSLIHDIQNVTLALAPPLMTEPATDFAGLQERGCVFSVDNASEIAAMVKIIKDANIRFDRTTIGGPAFITGVRLKTRDAGNIDVLFSEDSSTRKTSEGYMNHLAFTANPMVMSKIYSWAWKTNIKSYCESFMGPKESYQ